MKNTLIAFSFLLCMVFTINLNAQIKTPAPSPAAKVEQTVGLTKITIEYSRPSVKDRSIFAADGLVPYGKLWRTGANASTKIEFSDDVKIEGKELKAGKYALYMTPNAAEWKIVFYKNTSFWGTPDEYKVEDEALSISVKPQSIPMKFESMLFDVNNLKADQADIRLLWDKTMVSFKVEADSQDKVMKDIEKAMAGTTRGEYYVAARYYYDNDVDHDQAYEWVKKANNMEEKYWQLRLQALIEGKMAKYDAAIATAGKSTALAKEAGNDGYVKMNTESIAEWTKMKAGGTGNGGKIIKKKKLKTLKKESKM